MRNESVSQVEDRSKRFRVVCLRASGRLGLVRVCGSLGEANCVAKAVSRRHLDKLRCNRTPVSQELERPKRVFIQRWMSFDEGLFGCWESLEANSKAFAIEFFDSTKTEVKRNTD